MTKSLEATRFQRMTTARGTTIIPLHVTLGGLCRLCLERGEEKPAVKDCIWCRDCWENAYPGQLAAWGI